MGLTPFDKPVRILACMPDELDATSWYRGEGPLSEMERQGSVRVTRSNVVNWALLKRHDVLFLQRPRTGPELDAALMATSMKVPVWCDWDDNGLALKPWMHSWAGQADLQTLTCLLKTASLITVASTQTAETMKSVANAVPRVVRNAVDTSILLPRDTTTTKNRRVFYWRGTASHRVNLMLYEPIFEKLAHDYPNWTFVFQGAKPELLLQKQLPNVRHMNGVALPGYWDMQMGIAPTIGLVLWSDAEFDASRSDAPWLEMTWAGGLCIVPNAGDYKALRDQRLTKWQTLPSAGMYAPGDPAHLLHVCTDILKFCQECPLTREAIVTNEQMHISVFRSLTKAAEHRTELLLEMLDYRAGREQPQYTPILPTPEWALGLDA